MPTLCGHHVLLHPDTYLAFQRLHHHHHDALPSYGHREAEAARGRRARGHIQCSSSPSSIDSETSSTILVNSLRRCECYDLYDQHIPYKTAWNWQKSLVERRAALVQKGDPDASDALIILQHLPVYTLGTRSSEDYILFDKHHPPCEVYRTERGGEVTYHGPGQLVMYPLLNLRYHKMDLHWYLRSLEEVVIRALWSACAIEASRVEGLTGVWVGNQKVAAIGVRVSRWITYHGLALNVTTNLSPFKSIVPCGIGDRPVGSVVRLLENTDNQTDDNNSDDQGFLLDLLHKTLLREFSSVFGVDLIRMSSSIEW